MELMLVVWVVSFLSELRSLADFVVWPVGITAFILFVCTKIELDAVFKRSHLSLTDGMTVTVDTEFKGARSKVPKGVYTLDKYSTFSYLKSSTTRYDVTNEEVLYLLQQGVENEALLPAKPLCSGVGSLYTAAIALLALILTVPSDTTIKYMAGAYLVQSVYESDAGAEIGNAAKNAVVSQLRSWSTDNADLLELMKAVNKQENNDEQSSKATN